MNDLFVPRLVRRPLRKIELPVPSQLPESHVPLLLEEFRSSLEHAHRAQDIPLESYARPRPKVVKTGPKARKKISLVYDVGWLNPAKARQLRDATHLTLGFRVLAQADHPDPKYGRESMRPWAVEITADGDTPYITLGIPLHVQYGHAFQIQDILKNAVRRVLEAHEWELEPGQNRRTALMASPDRIGRRAIGAPIPAELLKPKQAYELEDIRDAVEKMLSASDKLREFRKAFPG